MKIIISTIQISNLKKKTIVNLSSNFDVYIINSISCFKFYFARRTHTQSKNVDKSKNKKSKFTTIKQKNASIL